MCLPAPRFLALTILSGSFFLSGCDMLGYKPPISHEIAELREQVSISVPATAARWEIFGTPEYTGGIPGPTDLVTLVAELETTDQNWFALLKEPTGDTFVTLEAARPWLSESFRTMLEKNKNSTVDMTKKYNCRKYQEKVKKSGRPVDGFICVNSGKALVYLTVVESQ